MRLSKPLLAAIVVVAAAAVAGWFRPVPQDIAPGTLPEERWALPSMASLERSSAVLGSEARKISWVSGATGGGTQGAGDGPSDWTLLGVVLDRGTPTALVRAAAKPDVLRVTPGGILPDGARLVAVERGGVVIDSNGCRQRRPVYAGGAPSLPEAAGACGAPQGNKEPGKS